MLLPQGEALNTGNILHQEIDKNRKLNVSHNENPLLNTLAKYVEFHDGNVKRYGEKSLQKTYYPDATLTDYTHMSWNIYCTTSAMVQKYPSLKSTTKQSK